MLYLRLRYFKLIRQYEAFFILLFVSIGVFVLDILFAKITFPYIDIIYSFITKEQKTGNGGLIDFAPEVWLGLLGLVLGTLIIVISVASQSTPKLIDLYTGDEVSLTYIWYIVISSIHNMFLQLISRIYPEHFKSSIMLNTYVLLPAALLVAVPYVLYILKYTKTSNVIEKIYTSNLRRIKRLRELSNLRMLNEKVVIATYQYELFEALNQLDDLLEYVAFKEPKGDVMNKISLLIQEFITLKKDLPDDFFRVSGRIANDVSFKTMTGQFEEMRLSRTFYEQKGFRLLGNAYIRLIDDDEFDLASLCAYELSECGRVAINASDTAVIKIVLVRFNTLLRFGIKHGLKNKEARNLYNTIFHYNGFIQHIIQSGHVALIAEACEYVNKYVQEIYRHSRTEPSFAFLVVVFTWEFKRILIELDKMDLSKSIEDGQSVAEGVVLTQGNYQVYKDLQKTILSLFLRIDNLSDAYEEIPLKGRKFNIGVRGLQIALALYYLNNGSLQPEAALPKNAVKKSTPPQEDLADIIIADIIQDHENMDKESLRRTILKACEDIQKAEPVFWEDTDRGNSNLNYSEDKAYISVFLERFDKSLSNFANE
jgi:hypothetical protein